MTKINISEQELKEIISESVKRALQEGVNEGFGWLLGRTQDYNVDKYIKSAGGGVL